MRATVIVRLKPGVLDPAGEAVQGALASMGFDGVSKVRISKLIEVDLDDEAASNPEAAKAKLDEMADKLLANPVIEDWSVELGSAAKAGDAL